MANLKMFKRFLAFAVALVLSAGLVSNIGQSSTITKAESTSVDITAYAERLKEISAEQDRIDQELADTTSGIDDQYQKEQAVLKKIKSINDKCKVLNAYMTQLEIQIGTSQRLIETKKTEIEQGVTDFKKRLRAMYLAGNDSYTTIIFESTDFYDILMRLELVKRVANHDNEFISNLIEIKDEYEQALADLETQKTEFDTQLEELNSQKEKLNKLYDENATAKAEMLEQKKLLEEQNAAYLEERKQFESDLSGILKSSYGDSSDETMRVAAELSANAALETIRDDISKRIADGEEIPEDECQFDFHWPVPSSYNISSGVGERWGTYHRGLDITAPHGTNINAIEAGTVIRLNRTCTHDYGKEASCGCGGGFGNFIIIDHGNGFISLYGHLSEVNVEVGDKVKRDDLIGHMGSTGYSTGDHLHLEIRYDGYFLNPASYVSIN